MFAEDVTLVEVAFFLNGSGAEDADVADEIRRRRGFEAFDGDGEVALASGIRWRAIGGGFQGGKDIGDGLDGEQELLMILFDGALALELGEDIEEAIPGVVPIQDERGFGVEIGVEGLVTDEDGDGLEHVLKAGVWSEQKGVGLDDALFDVAQGDALIAIGVVDVPASAEKDGEEVGAEFASGVDFLIGVVEDGSGKADDGHGWRIEGLIGRKRKEERLEKLPVGSTTLAGFVLIRESHLFPKFINSRNHAYPENDCRWPCDAESLCDWIGSSGNQLAGDHACF